MGPRDRSDSDRAIPKSSTLIPPAGVTMTLSAFKSRWTIFSACAAASAVAILSASRSFSSKLTSSEKTSRRVLPSTYSRTRKSAAGVSIRS